MGIIPYKMPLLGAAGVAAGVATAIVFPDKVNERMQAALAWLRDGQVGLDLHACAYGDCSRIWNAVVLDGDSKSATIGDWIQKGRWPSGLETLHMLQAAIPAANNERKLQSYVGNFDVGTARRLLECGSSPTAPNKVEGCGRDYFLVPTVENFFRQLARHGDPRMALLAKDMFLNEPPFTINNISRGVSVTRSVVAGRDYAFELFDALFAAGKEKTLPQVYQIAGQTAQEAFAKAVKRMQGQDLGDQASGMSNVHHLLFAQDAVKLLTRLVREGKALDAAGQVLDQLETARSIWAENTDSGVPKGYAAELTNLERMTNEFLDAYREQLSSSSVIKRIRLN